jgi:hypothetical protein
MNIANTKEVFDQLVVPRVASLTAVEERAAYDACRQARGATDKRCLLEYNALQKATTDRYHDTHYSFSPLLLFHPGGGQLFLSSS